MQLLKVLLFILKHPFNHNRKMAAILQFLTWQISSRISPYPVIFPFTSKSKIIAWKGLNGATGNIYCGLHEFEDMAFLLHFLREGDLFIDIGANIGSYTILASSHVGARTISFEPSPTTFNHLQNNIKVNDIKNLVAARNKGVGSKVSQLKFTNNLDTVNHIAIDGEHDTIEVPVNTLDDELKSVSPKMIKIDVEGFESEVIKGGMNVLKQSELCAVIMELNGSGERYGFKDQDIHQTMLEIGYQAYKYSPTEKKLIPVSTYGNANTLYLKNMDIITDRLNASVRAEIQGQMI